MCWGGDGTSTGRCTNLDLKNKQKERGRSSETQSTKLQDRSTLLGYARWGHRETRWEKLVWGHVPQINRATVSVMCTPRRGTGDRQTLCEFHPDMCEQPLDTKRLCALDILAEGGGYGPRWAGVGSRQPQRVSEAGGPCHRGVSVLHSPGGLTRAERAPLASLPSCCSWPAHTQRSLPGAPALPSCMASPA